MPNAENAEIQIEQGATLVPYAAMTDSGDAQIFTAADAVFSAYPGRTAELRPNGMVSGRKIAGTHATADTVAYKAFTADSQGTRHSVAAGSIDTRSNHEGVTPCLRPPPIVREVDRDSRIIRVRFRPGTTRNC